jgi:integral membrane protein
MLKPFRVVSLLEGCSYLAILSVTLGFISRDFVSILGASHGVLFIIYLFLALSVSNKQQWSIISFLSLFIAAIFPFAFIAVEIFISQKIKSQKLTDHNL